VVSISARVSVRLAAIEASAASSERTTSTCAPEAASTGSTATSNAGFGGRKKKVRWVVGTCRATSLLVASAQIKNYLDIVGEF